jgi:ribonuclease Z
MEFCFTGTSGAICSNENSNISFFVRSGQSLFLIDCPGDTALKAERCGVDIGELDALILTHSHPDHLYGLPQLIQHLLLTGRTRALRVTANRATAATGKALLALFHQDPDSLRFPVEWETVDDDDRLADPLSMVELFPVEHSIPTAGILFRDGDGSLLYSGDTGPGALEGRTGSGVTALIHEASGTTESEAHANRRAHCSARQAAQSAVALGAATLYLCHFADNSASYLEELRREAEEVFSGKVIIPDLYRWYTP